MRRVTMVQMLVLSLAMLLLLVQCDEKVDKTMNQLPRKYVNRWLPAGSAGTGKIVRTELMHRDHISSPLSPSTPKRLYQRFLEAAERSNNRRDSIMQNMRMRKSVASGSGSLQTTLSAGSGEYLMQISLGSPAQKFSTIVDTGSDLVWVQCLPCKKCFSQDGPKFDPSKSSTYKTVTCSDTLCLDITDNACQSETTCTYAYAYGDGSSTKGTIAHETLTLGTNSTSNVGFGCGNDNTGTFSGSGGLVGLGQGPVSLPSQLRPTIPEVFSYCLVNWDAATTTTSTIMFGSSATTSALKNTPILANANYPTYYYVGITGVSVDSQELNIPASSFAFDQQGGGGTIIDSGTTLTYWVTNVYSVIVEAFKGAINYPYIDGSSTYGLDVCYNVSKVPSPTFPEMTIHFTGADYQVPPASSFLTVDAASTVMCLAMADGGSPSVGFTIIGNLLQQNNLFVYDLVNKKIGFEPVDCTGA